jgi:DNA-nicking Smr family endonuclease
MRRRRDREPSEAELVLWNEVARSVRPLPGRKPLAKSAMPASAVNLTPASPLPPQVSEKPAPSQNKPQDRHGVPPALLSLDRKLRVAIKRGTRPVEAVIDLHGLRQQEAHAALSGFLHRSSARRLGLVLVVTGKGAEKGPFRVSEASSVSSAASHFMSGGQERGVLRRLVPHWLHLPELRPLIIGFEEAHPNHGGAGALYVRLKRPPGGSLP